MSVQVSNKKGKSRMFQKQMDKKYISVLQAVKASLTRAPANIDTE
jgi:hypothetical protein